MNHAVSDSTRTCDLAIIGGGIVGLWCAVAAREAGLDWLLIERGRPGGGASGSFLGALMPHQPVNWSAKKALQLDGLLSLPTRLLAATGKNAAMAGFDRPGRVVPLTSVGERDRNQGWSGDATLNWPAADDEGRRLSWQVLDGNPAPGWLEDAAASHGFAMETLSARANPRLILEALAGSLDRSRIVTGAVREVGGDGTLRLAGQEVIGAGAVIVAAGHDSFGLLQPLCGRRPGLGVKGQAALMRPARPLPDGPLPLIYKDGIYIIAHDGGSVAIGSTSENEWTEPDSTDGQLDALISGARALCPPLRDAALVERWAGVRPKHDSRDPVVTALPAAPRIIAATGGFKISYGIAHLMADAALARVVGRQDRWGAVLDRSW